MLRGRLLFLAVNVTAALGVLVSPPAAIAQPTSGTPTSVAPASVAPASGAPTSATSSSAAPLLIEGIGKGTEPIDGKWQFKTGDDLSWAQPGFDDSGWEQIVTDKSWGEQGHPAYTGFAWYRRHITIAPVAGVATSLSLYVPPVGDTVEVFWNGVEIGNVGTPPPHPFWYSVPRTVVIPLPQRGAGAVTGVLALRMWKTMLGSFDPDTLGGLSAPIRIGDGTSVSNMLTASWYRRLHGRMIGWAITLLGTLVMLSCLLAWLRDRRQWLFLWISLFYLVRLVALVLTGSQLPISYVWGYGIEQPIYTAGDVTLWLTLLWLFDLHRNRRWLVFTWVLVVVTMISGTLDGVVLFFWVEAGQKAQVIDGVLTVITTVVELYPFFLLYAGLRRRQQTPAILVGIAAFLVQMLLVVRVASLQGVRYTHWTLGAKLQKAIFSPGGMDVRLTDLLQLFLLGALVYASWFYSSQQRRRQATVEAELKSAQEIQQVLIPEMFEATPGVEIESVYRPASEVGGDFFQVIPLASGDTLIAIGDVSGKGLRAAMTVSLIVGTLRTLAEQTGDPSKILAGLNRRLIGRLQGGFATAIVARVSPAGDCVLANAGHPAPYLNHRELPQSGALPLGLDEPTIYASQSLLLTPADALVFYTDGVIEARNKRGELYGFSRLEGLLTAAPTATAITESACEFGQDDDITVLVVKLAAASVPAEVAAG